MKMRVGQWVVGAALVAFILSCNEHIDKQSLPPPPEKPVSEWPLNYQSLQSRILAPRCSRCHSVGGRASSVLFEPYATLIADNHKRWEAPGLKSKIVKTLTRPDKFRMPPSGEGQALSDEEVDFIVRWIEAGKPEF